jgi:hypothetical protein
LDNRDIWPESAVSAGQISQAGKAFQFGKILEAKFVLSNYNRNSSGRMLTKMFLSISERKI